MNLPKLSQLRQTLSGFTNPLLIRKYSHILALEVPSNSDAETKYNKAIALGSNYTNRS